jgi:hypothetical protein
MKLFSWVAFGLLCSGCSPSSGAPSPSIPDGDASDANVPDSAAPDTGALDGAGDADAPSDAPIDGPLCYADFPCEVLGEKFSCDTAHSYVPLASRDCHAVCGPGPCSGGTCASSGPEVQCPGSTSCVDFVRGLGVPTTDSRTTPCEDVDAQAHDGSADADGSSDASSDAPADASSDASSDAPADASSD